MGRLLQGADMPFKGKVGLTVGYTWKRIPCLRAYQKEVRYPNTAEQQRERDWFVAMVRFAAQARQALILGLHNEAEEKGMTEGNYFVYRNKQHFERTSTGITTDYARLLLANGPAADVTFHTAVFREHEEVSIDFEKNNLFTRASNEDKVYVYAYSHDRRQGILLMPVERKAKNITFRLPDSWSGNEVHLYGFVVDRDGRASNSSYIGAGKLGHYSEGTNYVQLNKGWMDFVEVANRMNANDKSISTVSVDTSIADTTAHPADTDATPPGTKDTPK